MADDLTWHGELRGMLIFGLVWWSWVGGGWTPTHLFVGFGVTFLLAAGALLLMRPPRRGAPEAERRTAQPASA